MVNDQAGEDDGYIRDTTVALLLLLILAGSVRAQVRRLYSRLRRPHLWGAAPHDALQLTRREEAAYAAIAAARRRTVPEPSYDDEREAP